MPPISPLDFGAILIGYLPYEPTKQQVQLVAALARFYTSPDDGHERAFLLSGYAGTGKTSLTGALVKAIRHIGRDVVLLAPTGRAAKVFSSFASHPAYTIHRKIYRVTNTGLTLASNPHADTLFIVDEASMIGDGDSLLSDLIHYVYTGVRCRLLFLGDTAQLPPVGLSESPAMSVDNLHALGLKVSRAQLTQTVRQAASSGILHNATWLRRAMTTNPLPTPQLTVSPFRDLAVLQQDEIEDAIAASYRQHGSSGAIVITRSNRRAVAYNIAIRYNILGYVDQLARGELLMVAKNNYHWSKHIPSLPFIANGDIVTVEHINAIYHRFGMNWADVTLSFNHSATQIDATIMLDTLTSETASIADEQMAALAREILADPEFAPKSNSVTAQRETLRGNRFFNALQVKYAYCVTCHKAQGGQWPDVFIDLAAIASEAFSTIDFYRWLYTAVTRASDNLYFISPTLILR